MTTSLTRISLGDLGRFQLGWPGVRASSPKHSFSEFEDEDDLFVLNTSHLDTLRASPSPTTDVQAVASPRYVLHDGDILFNVRNRPFRTSVVEVEAAVGPVVALGVLATLRLKDLARVNPYYLAGMLRSEFGQALVQPYIQISTNTTTINVKKLEDLQVPLPPREVQDRLAQLYQAADQVTQAEAQLARERAVYLETLTRQAVNP